MMNKQVWAGVVVAALTGLSGCGGGFFIDTNGGTSTATSSTGDYLYAVNPSLNTINEYSISSGALALVAGSPLTAVANLGAASIAVTRANTFVYVGGSGTISSYTIGTGGALTVLATQAYSAASTSFSALATSPDGQWLFAMDALNPDITVLKINTSTGALTPATTVPYTPGTNGTFTPRSIALAPTANFFAVALGTDGDAFFTFNTTTGALAYTSTLSNNSAGSGVVFSDNAVQFDSTGQYLFIARGTGSISSVAAYTVNAKGSVTTGATLASGQNPYGLLLESAGSYLYAVNRSDGTVSGYGPATTGGVTSASGAVVALAGSPYPTGTSTTNNSPVALVEDKSHSYVVAVGSAGGVDLTLYQLDALTGGKLDAVSTASSGAVGLIAIAATHGTGAVQ